MRYHRLVNPQPNWPEVVDRSIEMGQIEVFRSEQHLSRCAADFRKQMAELEELRELVCLAEAAKELRRPKGLARRAVHSKIVNTFAGSRLQSSQRGPHANVLTRLAHPLQPHWSCDGGVRDMERERSRLLLRDQ